MFALPIFLSQNSLRKARFSVLRLSAAAAPTRRGVLPRMPMEYGLPERQIPRTLQRTVTTPWAYGTGLSPGSLRILLGSIGVSGLADTVTHTPIKVATRLRSM